MPIRRALMTGLMAFVIWISLAPAAQAARTILVLGNAAFLNPRGVEQATGAVVSQDPALPLKDVAVLVLANVALGSLPQPIQDGIVPYVERGGSLLITGGSQSFGSGGYNAVAPVVPFQIRSANDWRAIPFRPPVAVQPGHPIVAGVTFLTVGTVNDMNPRPGATEILQSPGGGRAPDASGRAGGGSYPYPLIAEIGVNTGRAVGIAFDLNEFSGMRDRDLFIENTLMYLLAASRTGSAG